MKKSITYREITVAIGIIVAMVIALTLWVGVPGDAVAGSDALPTPNVPSIAKSIVESALTHFTLAEKY